MKIYRFLITLFLVLFLVGCQTITEGKIVDLRHQAAYTWIQWIPMSSGKTTTLIPITHYESERWIVVISDQVGDDVVSATYYVTEDEWKELELGDWYEVKEGR